MSEAKLRSINCRQCGAPLTLHGGHKVESLTCGFCGSVLDAHDDYKVLQTYKNLKRPLCPIKIGMNATIMDVSFTAIGVLQFRDEEHVSWVEVALFSPTHGYAWLEYDHGHFVFTRRTRDIPGSHGALHHKARFDAAGRTYKVHSNYLAEVTFVEGELTFVAKVGDWVRVVEGIDPPFGYVIEMTGEEQEYLLSQYLAAEDVYNAFGLDPDEMREQPHVHPLQPYKASGFVSGLKAAGMIFTPIALLLLLYSVVLGSGTRILHQQFTSAQIYSKNGVATRQFTVTDAENLICLELSSPFNNSWGFFDVVIKKDEEDIFSMAKEISYYSGGSGEDSWSEGSSDAGAFFRAPSPGRYSLSIYGQGGTGNRGQTPSRAPVVVSITEGVKVSRYYLILLVLCIAAWAVGWIAQRRFEAARWEDEDEDDDD
jgi:hypothetical protein